MKSFIKSALIFAAGLGIGGGVGWYVHKRKTDAHIDEEIEKRVAAEIEYHENGPETTETTEVEEDDEPNDISEDDDYDPQPSERKFVSSSKRELEKEEFLKNKVRTRYDTVSRGGDDSNDIDEELLRENSDDPDVAFEYLSPMDFNLSRYDYDQESLFWWPENQLLTDTAMDIYSVPGTIGPRWNEHMGEYETGVLYVRNHTARTEYDVTVHKGSYYDFVEKEKE